LLKPASPKSTRKTNDRLVRRFRRWRDVGGRDAIRRFDAVPVENKPPSTPQTAHGLCFSLARIRSICPYSRHKSFEPILRKDSTGFGGRRWRVIGRGLADRPFSTIAVFARRRHHTVRCLVTVPHLLGDGLTRDHLPDFVRVNPAIRNAICMTFCTEELAECLANSISCCHYCRLVVVVRAAGHCLLSSN